MKTIIQFLEDHKFLIKGHTKSQNNTDYEIEKIINKMFQTQLEYNLTNKIEGYDIYTAECYEDKVNFKVFGSHLEKKFPDLEVITDTSIIIIRKHEERKPMYIIRRDENYKNKNIIAKYIKTK